YRTYLAAHFRQGLSRDELGITGGSQMTDLRMRRQFQLVCRSGKDDTGGNRRQNYSRNAFSRKSLDSEHICPHFSGSDLPGFQLLPAIITFSAGGTIANPIQYVPAL